MTKILNAFNPCGTDMNPAADPRLAEFYYGGGRHPGHDNRVVWLSREDCSVKERLGVKLDEAHAFNPKASEIMRRSACDALLASFCPIKTVCKLVERGVPRDFDGIIGMDHEIPAWMSCLHSSVYNDLRNAINEVFPLAKIAEYAGIRTDWVMGWNKEDRSHELAVMDRTANCGPLAPMMSLYVPGWEYIKDRVRFKDMVERNVNRATAEGFGHDDQAFAVSPFIEGTQKDPGDYTSGDLVPVEAMTVIVKAINSIGANVAIWGAAYNEKQGNRFVDAVEQVVIPAVEAAEKEQGK